MRERELQSTVEQLLDMTGWRHLHVRPTIGRGGRWTTATSIVGFPDLFAYHPGQRRTLALELKSATGRLTAEQTQVLDDLKASGVETAVIRPADLQALAHLLQRKAAA